jgi:hypothetical protein
MKKNSLNTQVIYNFCRKTVYHIDGNVMMNIATKDNNDKRRTINRKYLESLTSGVVSVAALYEPFPVSSSEFDSAMSK